MTCQLHKPIFSFCFGNKGYIIVSDMPVYKWHNWRRHSNISMPGLFGVCAVIGENEIIHWPWLSHVVTVVRSSFSSLVGIEIPFWKVSLASKISPTIFSMSSLPRIVPPTRLAIVPWIQVLALEKAKHNPKASNSHLCAHNILQVFQVVHAACLSVFSFFVQTASNCPINPVTATSWQPNAAALPQRTSASRQLAARMPKSWQVDGDKFI